MRRALIRRTASRGDVLLITPVVRELVCAGVEVAVLTDFPEVLEGMRRTDWGNGIPIFSDADEAEEWRRSQEGTRLIDLDRASENRSDLNYVDGYALAAEIYPIVDRRLAYVLEAAPNCVGRIGGARAFVHFETADVRRQYPHARELIRLLERFGYRVWEARQADGLTIEDQATALANCDVFVGIDSFWLHMAQALRVPVNLLTGPVLGGVTKTNVRYRAIARDIPCAGCYTRRRRGVVLPLCEHDRPICMDMDPLAVMRVIAGEDHRPEWSQQTVLLP